MRVVDFVLLAFEFCIDLYFEPIKLVTLSFNILLRLFFGVFALAIDLLNHFDQLRFDLGPFVT